MGEDEVMFKKSIILKQPAFAQFNDEEVNLLTSLLFKKIFNPGEIIVNEGDEVDCVYFIISGEAQVKHFYIENNVLKQKSLATLTTNSSIGLNETGFYSLSGKRTATVIAKTTVETYKLNIAAFKGFALSQSRVSNIMLKQAEKFIEHE